MQSVVKIILPVMAFNVYALYGLYMGNAPYGTKFKLFKEDMDVKRQHLNGYDIKKGMFLVDCNDANGGDKVGMDRFDFDIICDRMENPLFDFMHHGYSMQWGVLITLYTTAIVVGIWNDSLIQSVLLLTCFLLARIMLFISFEVFDSLIYKGFDSSDHVQFSLFFVWATSRLVDYGSNLPWYISYSLKVIPLVLTFNSTMLTVQYYHTELEVMVGLIYGMITVIILEVMTMIMIIYESRIKGMYASSN